MDKKTIDIEDLKTKISNIVQNLINNASDTLEDNYMEYYTLPEVNDRTLMLSCYFVRETNVFTYFLDVHLEFICEDEIEDEYWLVFKTREQLECIILNKYINYIENGITD
jgi:hypothetical protein